MPKKTITTIEGLAEMIQRTMASTEDVQALDKKIQVLDTKVTAGFDRVEHLILEEQKRKIENLEIRMKTLEDALPAGRQASPSSPRFSDQSRHRRATFACRSLTFQTDDP